MFEISIKFGRNKPENAGGNNSLASKGGVTLQPAFTDDKSGKSVIISSSDFKEVIAALRGGYTDKNLIELFSTVAEIFAPIDAIATRAAGAKFGVRKKSTGAIIENNEEINKLLSSPNPFQNFSQFIYELICYELVTGKNYIFKNTPGTLQKFYKNIVAIWNLPADQITINIPERVKLFSATKMEDVILNFILDKGGRDETPFATDSIIYRKRMNLNWNAKKIEGRSPLLSAEMAVANLIAVYKARGTIYVKRGAMGMWVSRKSDDGGLASLTPAEKKEARAQLDSDYGIVGNGKHTVGLTEAPLDFVKSSMSIQELQPFEETSADAAAIYGVLGVPYELAPKPKGETFSNQATAERSLYQNNVIPLTNSICSSLTNGLLLSEWDYEIFANFNHVEILQSDANVDKVRIEALTKLYKDGGITYNQWLNKLGFATRGVEFDKYINEIESIPMAVRIGVGGTQAMATVVSDTRISEDGKTEMLVLLFGISEEQARILAASVKTEQIQNNQNETTAAN